MLASNISHHDFDRQPELGATTQAGSDCSLQISGIVEPESFRRDCCLAWETGQMPRYLTTLGVCEKAFGFND